MHIPLLDIPAPTTAPGIWSQNGSILGIVIVAAVLIVAAIVILGCITSRRARGSVKEDSTVEGGKS